MLPSKLWLLLAACGSAGPVLAQRGAIAPLAPVVSTVAAPPPLGVPVSGRPSARPAAPVSDQPPRTIRPQPVFLINSRIIVGGGLAKLNPQDIANIDVYRSPDAPAKWRSLATNGLLTITLKPSAKPKFKTESLTAIGRELRLRGAVSYRLEGLLLEDLSLRVVVVDIAGFDIQQTATGAVVNIRLVVPPPTVHPPGTIMIRGVSDS